MKKLIFFLLSTLVLQAQETKISGNLSTGFYFGTPFWNTDNISENNTVDPDDSFMRSVNRINLNGSINRQYGFRLNVSRSDGFQSDNHLANTKFYQGSVWYKFSGGEAEAGRFTTFNRWIHGPVDGAKFRYQLNPAWSVSVLGGLQNTYGLFYDMDHNDPLAYADVHYRFGANGIKLKALYLDQANKVGADYSGRSAKLNYSASYGFDLDNSRLSDGSLNLGYQFSPRWNLSANYRLFNTGDFKFPGIEFESRLLERVSAGLRYHLLDRYYLDFRQMATLSASEINYLSTLNFTSKYLAVGLHYLAGGTGHQRMGLNFGGNYSPIPDLNLQAGVTPVDYLYDGQEDHILTLSYYFRVRYQLFDMFDIGTNFNFYQDNSALNSDLRGGLFIRYNFGG